MNVHTYIKKLHDGETLSEDTAHNLFNAIFSGEVSNIQLASILTVMKMRGESSEEIAGAARSMREHAVTLPLKNVAFFDTCGTGGDNSHSFNVSSAVALVLTSMGVPVAKHGNRSMTSKSGSADFYEALGIPIGLTGTAAVDYFNRHGFIFLYAPNYHPAMKHAVPVRKDLGIRTIFNFLGPLTNPLGPRRQAIGLFHPRYLPLYGQVVSRLSYERTVLYSAESGMDEVSPVEPTHVRDIRDSTERRFTIFPADYFTPEEAAVLPFRYTAAENAAVFMTTLGSTSPTPLGKLLALNTALALYTLNGDGDFKRHYRSTLDLIHSGQVYRKVKELVQNNDAD